MKLLVFSLSICHFMQITAQFQLCVMYFSSFRPTVEVLLQLIQFVKCLPIPISHSVRLQGPILSSGKVQWSYRFIPAVDLNLLTC